MPYEGMMQNPPMLQESYFRHILGVSQDQSVADIHVYRAEESNTALTIQVHVTIHGPATVCQTRQLFIKTLKKTGGVYHELSIKEASFYQMILRVPASSLPISRCLDAYISQDKTAFLIVLEDISATHLRADEIDLSKPEVWLASARSLATFHASFWNVTSAHLHLPPKEHKSTATVHMETKSCYDKFLSHVNGRFDAQTMDIYAHVLQIQYELERKYHEQSDASKNLTLVHGDSHIHNFMFPKDPHAQPVMLDFQFWGVGDPTGDLAHLTRVSYPAALHKTLHEPVVRAYYDTLLACGVKGYEWQDCWENYRKQVACMLFIPIWQYTGFGLEYEYWHENVVEAVSNYKSLDCQSIIPGVS